MKGIISMMRSLAKGYLEDRAFYKQVSYLKWELRLNSSFLSRICITILRLERICFLKYIVFPFRVVILNMCLGVEIPRTVKLGGFLRVPHPHNIIIHPWAIIGNFVTIYQGVTIGANDLSSDYGAPKISSYCFLGANSAIIGNIIVGFNSIIAANSLVSKDVIKHSYFKLSCRVNSISLFDFYRRLVNEKIRNRNP